MCSFYEEVINLGDFGCLDHLLAAAFVDRFPTMGSRDLAGLKHTLAWRRSAFPDLHAQIDDLLAEDDKVVARLTWSATRLGDLMGLALTGRQVRFPGIDIFRIVDGRIVELWQSSDMAGMMMQLNVSSS